MTIKIKGKTVFVIVAGVGMIATAYFAAKSSPEAQKRKEAALEEKRARLGDENAQLTFVESAKAQVGAYAPAIISGIFALGGLVGSEVINEANLKKAEKSFDNFKTMTDKLDGKGASKIIEKAVEQKKLDEKNQRPWEEKETFRIVFQGKTIEFKSTRADVIEALYETNRYFQGRGCITFNEFLKNLGQDPVEGGEDRGWDAYVGEAIYGYTWIDFGLKQDEEDPWVTDIYFAVYPHFFDEEDAEAEIEEGVKKLDAPPSKIDDIPVEVKLDYSVVKKDDNPPW